VPRVALPLSLPVRSLPLRSRNSATRLAALTQAATLLQIGLRLLQSHRRALSKSQKCQGLHPVSRSGIGRNLHRLRVCAHVIVGYNVAIGGDEEAATFADDHTLRLVAVGKKNLKDHQMRDAPITTKSTPSSDAWDKLCASLE
jgi:hypothetical protein